MRALSAKNIFDKKHKTIVLDGIWADVLGTPEAAGIWLIYGSEKNGKTWFALMMAIELSKQFRVDYVSAEEGTGADFVNSCRRAGLTANNQRIKFRDYEVWDDVVKPLASTRPPKVVIVDNITIYMDELDKKMIADLRLAHPNTIFIFLAHEERNDAVPALAKHAKKLAKIIFHVRGLSCNVAGRCPGGTINIDEEKAALYHGQIAKGG